MTGDDNDRHRARQWMRAQLLDYVDGGGEVLTTLLAADCGYALGHPEWCDEPGDSGELWWLAFQVSREEPALPASNLHGAAATDQNPTRERPL